MTPTYMPSQLFQKVLMAMAIIGLLYLGRSVLAPITLAVMLGFMITPIVRQIRRLRVNQATAAIAALSMVGMVVAGLALVIFTQLSAMSQDLPRYETNVRDKLQTIRELTLGRIKEVQGKFGQLVATDTPSPPPPANLRSRSRAAPPIAPTATVAPSGPQAEDSTLVLKDILSTVWDYLGVVSVVVLVLVFALLEQNSLRDRLIRLTGGRDVRAATSALNDAGQRLSRYFISQFCVNLGVGLVVWALLTLLAVPYAAIWAVLAGLLRFIPYVGFPAAALCACAMSAAFTPGWDLVLYTGAAFLCVELVAAYLVEPMLYGHSTGLSPFSVVVSAIFWGALWGPVGLLLSTPLTLCLVVAGRHVPALAFLDILFGDAPALDLSQRFYQRSLSGDVVEILSDARAFLKRKSLAAYCDKVIIPAFEMGREDFAQGLVNAEQQSAAQYVILQFFAELEHAPKPARPRSAVLDSDIGMTLRKARQVVEGRTQGPLDVPAGSMVMCVSMAGDETRLTAELLVRVLRMEKWDARHITIQEVAQIPDDAHFNSVGTLFVIGNTTDQADPKEATLLADTLQRVLQAQLVLMLPWMGARSAPADPISNERPHLTAYSFEEAVSFVQHVAPNR